MTFLVDTNIALRMAEPGHKQHQEAMDAVTVLDGRGHDLVVVPQNLYEFWVACTRPLAQNGLGKTPAEAAAELATVRRLFGFRPETPDIYPNWLRQVTTHAVSGKVAHDTRLVAAMEVRGIANLLTFNNTDFKRFPTIRVWTPADVSANPL